VARKLVVYVEDNPVNFALVRRILESTGSYDVTLADDGPIGLTTIAEQRPDLVLLDLDLPTMHGLEVLRELKADPSLAKIPVIIISASVMQRERTKALEGGAAAFLEKPFDIAGLRKAAAEAVGLDDADG
jgi:CheY-like chemotaxis protein